MAQKKKRKTKIKPPTAKQKAFIEEYIKTRNITKSAAAVYDVKNDRNASRLGTATLKSPNVLNYIQNILKKVGLTDRQLSESLERIITKGTRENLDKTTPSDALRGIEMAFKLMDRFPAERKVIDKREIKLEAKTPEELSDMLEQLTGEARKYKELLGVGS